MVYQVWYQRPETLTSGSSSVTRSKLMDTHVCLGWIDAAGPEHVFAWLNDNEQPHAKSRALQRPELIAEDIIAHSSMSVGDVLIDAKGDAHVCSAVGWSTLAP